MSDRLLPPPVLWAQRKKLLYIKVQLEDCRNPSIKVEKDSIYFKGKGGTDNKEYEVTLEFLKEIKPEESKYSVKDRATEFVLIKAEDGYWKRLLKEDTKFHWLKVDFNKWKDEDDVEETDFEEMMRQMDDVSDVGMNDVSDLNYAQDILKAYVIAMMMMRHMYGLDDVNDVIDIIQSIRPVHVVECTLYLPLYYVGL